MLKKYEMGRPKRHTQDRVDEVKRLVNVEGNTRGSVAKHFSMSTTTVQAMLEDRYFKKGDQ
ncbi:hypothetical protein [Vibrio splendidus]|uniref:hypothetical protein n=1 Tax=Vibrio splendidus TaxID=29497 RepID=UPI0021B233F0|nr:hypothetical protein [Vibrio splendidus]UWZ96918.1 hypothetical protein IM698_10895 [Vibrio splendidus]